MRQNGRHRRGPFGRIGLRRRLRRVVATFALAHMSCAGAWAWGAVPDRLRAAGHDGVAPDFTLVAGATPESHARELTAAVGKDRPSRSVILVGHSYGGLVVPRAAELLGDAAAALVVVDGLMPEPGESGFDLRPARADARRAEGRNRGDGMWTAGSQSPEPAWWRRLQPMPVSTFDAAVESIGTAARLPGWFVHCLRSDFADQAARARARGWNVVEVDGVHALPLTDPATCVQVLLTIASSIRTAPHSHGLE
jgi:pimeloyl-ACP methyl ester carboxylesterase